MTVAADFAYGYRRPAPCKTHTFIWATDGKGDVCCICSTRRRAVSDTSANARPDDTGTVTVWPEADTPAGPSVGSD